MSFTILPDLRIVRSCGAIAAIAGWLAVVAALYLLASSGAWTAVPSSDGAMLGFLPDPSYAMETSGCSFAEAVTAACLAHAAVMPVSAIVVSYLVLKESFGSGGASIAFARGVGKAEWLLSKFVVSCIAVVIPFVLATVIRAGVFCIFGELGDVEIAQMLAPRLCAACLVAIGYVAFCFAVFLIVGIGPVAAGVLVVSTVAGFIAQVSLPGTWIQTPMGALAMVSGVGWSGAFELIPIALTAFAACSALAYAGLLRRAKA